MIEGQLPDPGAIQYWKRQKLEWQTGQIFWLQFWPLPVGVLFAGLKCLTGCPAYQSCFSPKGSGWICPTGLFQIDLIGMPGLHKLPIKRERKRFEDFYWTWCQIKYSSNHWPSQINYQIFIKLIIKPIIKINCKNHDNWLIVTKFDSYLWSLVFVSSHYHGFDSVPIVEEFF